jgi:hypothetical protein
MDQTKFFLSSLQHSLNSEAKLKFSDFQQVNCTNDYPVYSTEISGVTFFVMINDSIYTVLVDSVNDKLSSEALNIGTATLASALSSSKAVATIIINWVNSNLIQDLIEVGTFGYQLIGIQKLEKQVKLTFQLNDNESKIHTLSTGQEFEKHLYFDFDAKEAEMALILLNISGNGNITEMVTRFIATPNLNNPFFNLTNGGVEAELQHCIAWVISRRHYKVQHLKK